jgi:hypothetical protein
LAPHTLLPARLVQRLQERGIRIVEVPDEEFETMGPNVLALEPGVVLALARNRETQPVRAGARAAGAVRGRRAFERRRRPDASRASVASRVASGPAVAGRLAIGVVC